MPGNVPQPEGFLVDAGEGGNLVVLAAILLLWHLVFSIFGFYESKADDRPGVRWHGCGKSDDPIGNRPGGNS